MAGRLSDQEFIELWRKAGGAHAVAKATGMDVRSIYARRRNLEKRYDITLDACEKVTRTDRKNGARADATLGNGRVIVFSDAHFEPNYESTALHALLTLCKELKPAMVIANGDILDGSSISAHDPLGWSQGPSLKDELEAVQQCMGKIEKAAKGAQLYRTIGNHDIRFDKRLAMAAPQYRGLPGTQLSDHLPGWNASWSLFINKHTMVKHRFNGGIHAGYNNTVKAGTSIITGHTHQLEVKPWGDYNGRRYGVQTGMLADPDQPEFEYCEDNPRPWCSGFAVLSFVDGRLAPPELCEVIEGAAWFRGQRV